MLRSVKAIEGYKLEATDGEIGKCADFLFDDERWTIRYMVAETGNWLAEHKVLISPVSLDKPEWITKTFPVKLTKAKIEGAPSLEENAPVSRRYEIIWNEHFGWPCYWCGTGLWQNNPTPTEMLYVKDRMLDTDYDPEEVHARSCDELTGAYHIRANDGKIGHVEDFILDDENWAIRYLVVNTRDWLPGGRSVLVTPSFIKTISWEKKELEVDLSVEQIKNSPKYDPNEAINREYEKVLFDYYGRPVYWEKE